MISATEHHTGTSVRRSGGRSWGHQGGHYRESEAYCSCGWADRANGQTYAESMQAIREHLKEMDVYNTDSEQMVYAHIRNEGSSVQELVHSSGKSKGIVLRSLRKFIERGNVEAFTADQVEEGTPGETYYKRTDKWFSWND